ncbi:ribosome small subunit-dependent GTPase A [Paenibacillus thermoaerophilus]|uniref:Small ribosomal subunit biogenesis GTPase RsgA n=1 Tax=Paenibacillus thermoaerophilus TaxID=1215385 RepID=A0ABW2V2A8_9BACL|nr:ribosome small subunit-dependent GTPase A [Paenibacillus thermoaerophilus]TMV19155.1 ribosome small subunit-dependent GTPase A [Paenibacillus thermoaerophilus]
MPQGLIVKALSGYYYVRPDEGTDIVQCRARGIFKKRGESPLVGDRVDFELTENGEGTVVTLHPRRTELIRPPVANIDLAVLVFSVAEPDLNLQLLDKFLVHTEQAGLDTVIVLSKIDLVRQADRLPEEIEQARRLYESIGYEVIPLSAREGGDGVERVRKRLAGSIAVFSGQSGVGKSSLLNAIVPGLTLETSEISHRLGRGRHTTRHVELVQLPGGGYVADTPGFSQLDFLSLEPEDLGAMFREFRGLSAGCRFRGCLHSKEPGCAVRQAVEEGTAAESRYRHYLSFLEEMKERRRRY